MEIEAMLPAQSSHTALQNVVKATASAEMSAKLNSYFNDAVCFVVDAAGKNKQFSQIMWLKGFLLSDNVFISDVTISNLSTKSNGYEKRMDVHCNIYGTCRFCSHHVRIGDGTFSAIM